jgi:multidrug resistance efflux pump
MQITHLSKFTFKKKRNSIMKKTTIVILGFVVMAMLAGCGAPGGSKTQSTPTAGATQPSINTIEAITATGKVIPVQDTALSFVIPGAVSEVLVTEGREVQAGQVLARLDGAQPLQAALAGAELETLTAQLALEQLSSPEAIAIAKLAVTTAQTNVTNAQTVVNNQQYWKNEALIQEYYAKYVIAKDILDKAQTDYDKVQVGDYINNVSEANAYQVLYNAKQAYDTAHYYWSLYSQEPTQRTKNEAQANLDLANTTLKNAEIYLTALDSGDIPADASGAAIVQLQQARLAVQVSQDKVEAANAALANLELKAPFGGTVTSLNLKIGIFVQPGMEMAKLADTSSWLVKTTDLTELNVVRIEPGMEATVTLDAIPGVQMTAQVQSIDKFGQSYQGDIVYAVVLKLNQPDPHLRWNMTATVMFGNTK